MASLMVERLAPVVVLMTLISAAGTAWWSGSVKRPLSVPKLLCPRTIEHKRTQRESASARRDLIGMKYNRDFPACSIGGLRALRVSGYIEWSLVSSSPLEDPAY